MEIKRRKAAKDGSKSSKNGERDEVKNNDNNGFHYDLWLLLAVENWIFDFGRPIAAILFPLEWFPMNCMSIGDYFHMAYNVITPFCLLKLIERSPRKISTTITYIIVIFFVMGASIHLVGDSISHRLTYIGYKLHLSVRENPIMMSLEPRGLVDSFELLYSFDEVIGHLMWYIPFFLCLFLYYLGSFQPVKSKSSMGLSIWMLLLVSAVYYWYLVTEGQIFLVYIFTYTAMLVSTIYNHFNNQYIDINGQFLFYTFTFTNIFIVVWVALLWNNDVMRNKYPGILYVPEPWSVYSYYYPLS